jgi:hypothetical protein
MQLIGNIGNIGDPCTENEAETGIQKGGCKKLTAFKEDIQ